MRGNWDKVMQFFKFCFMDNIAWRDRQMTEHLIVVHCPRCGRSDWRLVEWTGGTEDNVYECTHCDACLTVAAYHMLAKEQHDKETAVDRLIKLNKGWGVLLDSMDGEDSQ